MLSFDVLIWEEQFEALLKKYSSPADSAHDLGHIYRVVINAKRLCEQEGGNLAIVLPAAWLHDCVSVPKNSPLRSQASALAAEQASQWLAELNYPAELISPIAHAITAHSFSAGIPPQTLEAKIVQDADRLEAIGAIGLARCLITGVSMGTALYHPTDPFGESGRVLNDSLYSVDHFYLKLLKLADQMQTPAGRAEAQQRTTYLHRFLSQLRHELVV